MISFSFIEYMYCTIMGKKWCLKHMQGTHKIIITAKNAQHLRNSINTEQASVIVVSVESHHAFSNFINSNPLCQLGTVCGWPKQSMHVLKEMKSQRELLNKRYSYPRKRQRLTPCAFHHQHSYSMSPT